MTTRNWNILEQYPGYQPIEDTSTVQNHPIGARVKALHATYGEGEFIYCKGVANTVVGDACTITVNTGATVRALAASRGLVGVAMSINVANQYGWYQIFGTGVVKAGTVANNGQVFSTATAGTVDDAVVAGSMITGAILRSADGTPAAGFALVSLIYPSLNGVPA